MNSLQKISPVIHSTIIVDEKPSFISKAIEAIKALWELSVVCVIKPIENILLLQNIIKIINVPYSVNEVVQNRKFFEEQDQEKRIDKGLKFCNDVREVGEITGGFFVALETIKAISIPVAIFGNSFNTVISFLSISSIITQYRTCMKVWLFMNALKATKEPTDDGKTTLRSYERMLDLVEQYQTKDPSFISEVFNVDEEKLKNTLSRIKIVANEKMSSCHPNEAKKAQNLIEKAANGLKDRVQNHFISSAVALVASVVSLIGTVILLAMTSAAIGWTALGVLGIMIDLELFFFHKITDYQFADAVDLKRSKWEWVTC